MPSQIPSSSRPRFFSTATHARASVPPNFTYRAVPLVAATAATASTELGRVARWYLPAMAAVAVGMTFIPETFFDEPSKRTVTLGEANRRIDFAISHQLDEHNRRANDGFGPTLEERNRAMLNSFGGRSSLEDMERVIAGYEDSFMPKGRHEKNVILEEAFGERSNLKHLRRAMELYEVQ